MIWIRINVARFLEIKWKGGHSRFIGEDNVLLCVRKDNKTVGMVMDREMENKIVDVKTMANRLLAI